MRVRSDELEVVKRTEECTERNALTIVVLISDVTNKSTIEEKQVRLNHLEDKIVVIRLLLFLDFGRKTLLVV